MVSDDGRNGVCRIKLDKDFGRAGLMRLLHVGRFDHHACTSIPRRGR